MAVAALEVLGLTERIAERLDPDRFVPAVGQGCVAVECRADDASTAAAARRRRRRRRPATRSIVERAFLAELGSGCSLAVGAHCVDGRAARVPRRSADLGAARCVPRRRATCRSDAVDGRRRRRRDWPGRARRRRRSVTSMAGRARRADGRADPAGAGPAGRSAARAGATVEHVALIAIGPPADGGVALRAALAGWPGSTGSSSRRPTAPRPSATPRPAIRRVRLAAVGRRPPQRSTRAGRPARRPRAGGASGAGLLAEFPSPPAACSWPRPTAPASISSTGCAAPGTTWSPSRRTAPCRGAPTRDDSPCSAPPTSWCWPAVGGRGVGAAGGPPPRSVVARPESRRVVDVGRVARRDVAAGDGLDAVAAVAERRRTDDADRRRRRSARWPYAGAMPGVPRSPTAAAAPDAGAARPRRRDHRARRRPRRPAVRPRGHRRRRCRSRRCPASSSTLARACAPRSPSSPTSASRR